MDKRPNVHAEAPTRRMPHGATKKGGAPRYLVVALLVALMFAVAAVFTFFVVRHYYRPTIDTGVPFTTTDPDNTGDTSNTPKITRNTDVVNFLVMGKDAAATNTDVIMIVNFNTKTYELNVVQLPRDTYVRYDDIDAPKEYRLENDMYAMRANAIFSHYTSPVRNPSRDKNFAMQKTVEKFERLFSIQIDYYALVELSVFRSLIDAIGGVYVDVPFDMVYNDPAQSLYINLKAGYQLLDGEKAEQFVRWRMTDADENGNRGGYSDGDLGRTDAMKKLIAGILDRVRSGKLTLKQLSDAVKAIYGSLTTDVKLSDALYYVDALVKVDMNNVCFATVPGHSSSEIHWNYVLQRSTMLEIVNSYLNVYDQLIDSASFDSAKLLVDPENSEMMAFYNATDLKVTAYSAAEAGDIEISHYGADYKE